MLRARTDHCIIKEVLVPLRSGGPAPYAPPQTVLTLIRTYRSRGLQTPFSPDVLQRAGVPGTLTTRVTQALKLLDLIDESNNPTTEFEALRRAGDAEFPERLAALIRSAYAEVFKFVDPAQDGEQRVRDAFRAFEPLGQLTRMVTLFLALCEAAGIVAEDGRQSAPKKRSTVQRATRNEAKRTPDIQNSPKGNPHARRAGLTDDPAASSALLGLIRDLPWPSIGWTKDRRDKWMKAIESAVDYAIPVRTPEEIAQAIKDDE
jgi:hypothetical protein